MKDCNARPPSLPRIFDHKRYAEAARADYDERMRNPRRFMPVHRRRRDLGEKIGYAMVGAALLIALAAVALSEIGSWRSTRSLPSHTSQAASPSSRAN